MMAAARNTKAKPANRSMGCSPEDLFALCPISDVLPSCVTALLQRVHSSVKLARLSQRSDFFQPALFHAVTNGRAQQESARRTSCQGPTPRCSRGLEAEDGVELPALQPAFRCGALRGHDLAAEEPGEADLHVRISLIVGFNPVVDVVCGLPQVAEVKRGQNGVSFDAHEGITQ